MIILQGNFFNSPSRQLSRCLFFELFKFYGPHIGRQTQLEGRDHQIARAASEDNTGLNYGKTTQTSSPLDKIPRQKPAIEPGTSSSMTFFTELPTKQPFKLVINDYCMYCFELLSNAALFRSSV
jgi:hypothetical protein